MSGDTFSLKALKFCRLNSESAMARAQLALKENGRYHSDWFIARYAQKHPLLIKRTGTTRLDHVPGHANRFPVIKLATVDLETP